MMSYFSEISLTLVPDMCTMPWNRLGTPRKFKFRIRKMKNSASQLGQWPKIIIKKTQINIFEKLILDGTLERAKKLYMDFSKITVFPMSFFPLCCKLAMAGSWQQILVVQIVNFCWIASNFLDSVDFYFLRPSRHCAPSGSIQVHLGHLGHREQKTNGNLKMSERRRRRRNYGLEVALNF